MRKRAQPPLDKASAESPGSAATLARGLDILRAFTASDTTLGNQDLIERTGLPKATISRLTLTLTNLGYLHYNDRLGRYSIGPATVSLGYSALSSSPVVHIARPLMEHLTEKTGAAVAIGMRDGLEMVYIATCRPISPVTLRLDVGSRLPIWRTANGLAHLAVMERAERTSIVEQLIEREPAQAKRIASLVDQAVVDQSQRGFVGAFGAWYSYINAVGTCFFPTDGSPTVSITCGGIVDILPREVCMTSTGPELIKMTEQLKLKLAGNDIA
ncbi:IclR family transcriptional regulator [Martelella soudanensis]|uniref:IclR family transcriptional regulator n=1 Tax=unclassified Martelella TaxID=2629616 RepID=UPI0015E01465|nr:MULTISPECIES: IclR family transcriptional regulator [unclassified Martelella]